MSPKVNRLRLNPRQTDPVSPAEGDLQYADGSAREEGLWVYKNSAWVKVGSDQLGSINYISNGDAEAGNTSGWSLGNATLTSAFPSGTPTFGSGANANLSLTNTTVTPLAGTRSFLYASSTATTAGNFLASDAFTIDAADQAKPLTISFNYQVVSGTVNMSGTSSNSFGIAIYDVSAAQWIMPAGVWNLVQSSGVGKATATFQTSPTSTQYRLVLFNANATSGAVSLELDRISVGPQSQVLAPAVSDWQSFTPTGSWTTNTTYTGLWRRVGDSLDVQYRVLLSGAPTAAALTLNLPSGLTIDAAKLVLDEAGANPTFETSGFARDTGVSGYSVQAGYNNTTSISVYALNASSTYTTNATSSVNNLLPFTFGASDEIFISVKGIPIAGWSSNSVMSQDTDTRVVALSASSTSTQTITTTPSQVTGFSASVDTHAGLSSNTYTIPVSGTYRIYGKFTVGATSGPPGATIQLRKNNSNIAVAGNGLATTQTTVLQVNTITSANAGDTITLFAVCSTSATLTSEGHYLTVERLSGPAVVAASETVNFRGNRANTSLPSTTATTVVYSLKDYDSHNAYNTSTGVYTVPVSGKYLVKAAVQISALTLTTTQNFFLQLVKNSSPVGISMNTIGVGSSTSYMATLTDTYFFNAGDTISVQATWNGSGTATLNNTTTTNIISIDRIGN